MDPEKKSLNFIFPTKYVFPKSLAIGQVSRIGKMVETPSRGEKCRFPARVVVCFP